MTASTSRVAAFFGPRFNSNVERLPPLRHKHTKRFQLEQQHTGHLLKAIVYFFYDACPTLEEVGRTPVGLATDCRVETAVADRRQKEREEVHICID